MALLNQKKVKDLHKFVMERDKELLKIQKSNDVMFDNNPAEPEGFEEQDWFRWNPTTMPSDAIWGSERTLSRHEPSVKFAPFSFEREDRDIADKYERVLLAQWLGAGKVGRSKHLKQILQDSLKYDMVTGQVKSIPWQMANAKKQGVSTHLLEQALQKTQNTVHIRNPKFVHPIFAGEYGLETVVWEQVVPLKEFMAEWGEENLKALMKNLSTMTADPKYVYRVEVTTHEQRVVLAYMSDEENATRQELMAGKSAFLLDPNKKESKHGLPFHPWIVKGGGSSTATQNEKNYRPLLDSVLKSGQYDTYNLVRSLMVSGVFVQFGENHTVSETEDGEYPMEERDGTTPEGTFTVRIGEKVYRLPAVPFDTGLIQLAEMLKEDISASTISRVLMGEIPTGAAFATMSLGAKNAVKVIVPYQRTGEDWIAEAMEHMLKYAAHAKISLESWVNQKPKDGSQGTNAMETIDWEFINPTRVQVAVELKPDIVTDDVAAINAGLMLLQAGASRHYILGEAGVQDATRVMEERVDEDIDQVEQANLQKMLSKEFEDEVFQAATALVQQQAAEAEKQAAIQAQGEGQGEKEPLTQAGDVSTGERNLKGPGADPSKGGGNTQGNPAGRTRESVNRADNTGEPSA